MSELSDSGHNDYLAADAVLAEVAEAVTRDLAERAVSEAVEVTFHAAVNHPVYPERRPWMDLGTRSIERPQRSCDMQIEDLHPGTRIVFYNDKLMDKQKYAKHEVVLSEPYEATNDHGERFLAVEARRVDDHATDMLPLDSDQGRRLIALSTWGLAPLDDGHNPAGYNTTKYIERYVTPEFADNSAK